MNIYSTLYRYILSPVYHQHVKQDQIYSNLSNYRKVQFWEREQIIEYQLNYLKTLLNFAYLNVNYYKIMFNKIGFTPNDIKKIEDYNKLPIITKNIIRQNYQDFQASILPKNRYLKNSTSGSTGENFWFYSDKNSFEIKQALHYRMNDWLGINIGDKAISFWGSPLDIKFNNNLISKTKRLFKRSHLLSAYNLRELDIITYIKFINDFKPKLISGYPSVLNFIAEYILINGGLTHFPTAIRTESETLFDYQRQNINNAFKTSVYNYYSSRDITGIAHECSKGNLHVFDENVILQVINEKGEYIDNGPGEVIITDLHNFVMPFLKYQIGDQVEISDKPCDCGRHLTVLKKVIGRTFDVITFPNGNKVGGTFWTLLARSAQGITKFQIVQEKTDLIIWKIVRSSTFQEKTVDFLRSEIKKKGGENINIQFEFLENIEPHSNGKTRFIISKVNKV